MDDRLIELLDAGFDAAGPVVVMTGAGISADSGIPTFRGEEGYWTVGSENHHPMEMATHAAFERMPEQVWRWYLYRRSVCRGAEPNDGHRALVRLEEALGDRFLLITQNVDGLHLRAGSSMARTYQIHGNIDFMRCEGERPAHLRKIPLEIGEDWTRETPFTDHARRLLACCPGGAMARPHVLWFDECYDEELFHFESSIRAATSAALLIVIGTSGSTNLPMQVGAIVAQRGAPMIVINRDESPFSEFAERSASGWFARGPASEHLPAMVEHLLGRAGA
ncbi:MAG TPA: Sir2 family NAD-dependent protein deacetylase [Sandaracinaceae bacterium LLY-WYZ-13_1]|nr:Sir2 family NAD-dependent protein deacetylase [Sandaracinaceae bacterium LLY-WYZ-13_1]